MRGIIIQRTVPHYRVPLFEQLYREFGWVVATAKLGGGNDGMAVDEEQAPWIHRFDFVVRRRSRYNVAVPIDEICERLKPDAIISEFSLQMSSSWALARLARHKNRPKIIFWSQGWDHERGFRYPQDLAFQLAWLHVLRKADAQICYSEAGANYLRRLMPEGVPVFTAPNTIATPISIRTALPIKDIAPQRLLFVGRLTPDKRVLRLIEIVTRARERLPDLTLSIVGDGPDRAAVQNAADKAGSWVTFKGPVYDPQRLSEIFDSATLFIYAGSIGLAVNEALARGVPVMIYDSPGRGAFHHPEHEYVKEGHTGYRVQQFTTRAMAQRIVEVLSSPVSPRNALARTIQKAVHDDLSIDRMVGGFRNLVQWLKSPAPKRGKADVAFVWDNFGPMHDDRCRAVACALGGPNEVLGVELFSTSDTYSWHSAPAAGFAKQTLFAGADRRRVGTVAVARGLTRAVGRSGASTIFLCHYERAGIFLAALALRLQGLRVLTMGDMKYDDKKRVWWLERLKRIAMLPYQGALAASTRTADYMRFLGVPPERICFFYDNISVERVRSAAADAPVTAYEDRTILSVARFVPKKNHRTIVAAYRKYVSETKSPRRLVLCGDGPLQRETAEQIRREGLSERVDMLGFVDGRGVAREMKRALCLLLPSIEEQFGIVVLEALALGLPVIVSDACGARDLYVRVGLNGFVVKADNASEIASLLQLLGGNEELWSTMSREAFDSAAKGDVTEFARSALSLLNRNFPVDDQTPHRTAQ